MGNKPNKHAGSMVTFSINNMITYEDNLKGPKGEEKSGANRIVTDENKNIISKEYLPDGIPKCSIIQSLLQATPEEIEQIKNLLSL